MFSLLKENTGEPLKCFFPWFLTVCRKYIFVHSIIIVFILCSFMLFAFQHDNPASYSPTPRFVTSHFLHPGPPLSFLPCSSSERFLCSACCLSHCQSGAQMRIPEVLVIAVCIFAPGISWHKRSFCLWRESVFSVVDCEAVSSLWWHGNAGMQ